MKPFQCSVCHAALGETDGEVLAFSTAMVAHPISLVCLNCGSRRIWRPLTILPMQKRHVQRLTEKYAERMRLTLEAMK